MSELKWRIASISERLNSGLLPALLGSLLLGIAWWYTETTLSALLTWPAALCFVIAVHKEHSIKNLYLAGILFQPLGFYWLYGTISHFGNFSTVPSLLIFTLYTVLSAVQFAFFALLHKYLPKSLDTYALRAPLAWVTAELLSIRIFPWHLGHTEIAIVPFVQIADLVGSLGVSFMVMWIVESIILVTVSKRALFVSVLFFILSLTYGYSRIPLFLPGGEQSKLGEPLSVALVQGNIPLEAKHDAESLVENLRKYYSLSLPFDNRETLIIWPETVMLSWVHTSTDNVLKDRRIPKFDNATFLFGTLMFTDERTMYNSVLAVRGDGVIGPPYHKQVLMPFGEYTPFGETFPWLRELNATAGDFTRSTTPGVHTITYLESDRSLQLASLICYEDVVQSLGASAAKAGAEMFVNHTNDAWFGNTAAPYQHHLIAIFRAVENKRYHLRGTNTGLTAVVDPFGRTLSSLKPYTEGVLEETVYPVSEVTVFSRYGNTLWWIVALFVVGRSGWRMVRYKL